MLYQQTAILLIPFLGTSLGSAMVFFTKNKINEKFQKFLLGFASGVMIAASVWSLIIPSVEMSAKQNVIEWLPAAVGFLLGIGFLLLLDSVIPHLHLNSDKPEGVKSRLSKNTMLVLAVTLHNIPEGIAVALPIYHATGKKRMAIWYSFWTGMTEPIGALIGLALLHWFLPQVFVGFFMAAVVGIMIYISFDTLLPLSHEYGDWHYAITGIMSGVIVIWASLLLLNGY